MAKENEKEEEEDPTFVPDDESCGSFASDISPSYQKTILEALEKGFIVYEAISRKVHGKVSSKRIAGIDKRRKECIARGEPAANCFLTDQRRYQLVKAYIKEKFGKARLASKSVRSYDFEAWIDEAVNLHMPSKPCTSLSYFTKLKKELHISFRRINRFVTQANVQQADKLVADAKAFNEEVLKAVDKNEIVDTLVWNADQSPFYYELVCNRSYAEKGSKTVEAVVVDQHAITHSYTLMVHMNRAGKLGRNVYICFKETTGRFGVQVTNHVKSAVKAAKCVVAEASKSGKMTGLHFQRWKDEVFLPEQKGQALLLLDSWGGHITAKKQITAQADQPPECEMEVNSPDDEDEDPDLLHFSEDDLAIMLIPKSTTKYCQPLDVYFFRQYKILVRRIVDYVRRAFLGKRSTLKPNNRYFIIKMHGLVYNQLSAPVFNKMLLYAWSKAGYVYEGHRPDKFRNVNSVCIKKLAKKCDFCPRGAEKLTFIRCSWCTKNLCFDHFAGGDNFHYHEVPCDDDDEYQ